MEMFRETFNLPKDMEISNVEISADTYTLDIYGFSEVFPEVAEGAFSSKKTLQWV